MGDLAKRYRGKPYLLALHHPAQTALSCTGPWGIATGRAEPSRNSATGLTRSSRMRATPMPASREPSSLKSAASR